ncbi:hypothetical protein ACSBR1_026891 [Camellia fascicularis]
MIVMKRLVNLLIPSNCFLILLFKLGIIEMIGRSLGQILPNGTAWIPNLVETIADVVSNGIRGIFVDLKLIKGPDPNERWKILIPFILAFQYFFVVKRIQRWIKDDMPSTWE